MLKSVLPMPKCLPQGIELEPLLQKISDFMDDHHELVELVRDDLERGLKKPKTGRKGLTPNQVLRSLMLMRIKNWDYRELRERIRDGYTLRNFTGFYSRRVPKHNAFNQAFNRLTFATVEKINEAVIQAAVQDGLEDGTPNFEWIPLLWKAIFIGQPMRRCSGTLSVC
jgi:IS5 family transposase